MCKAPFTFSWTDLVALSSTLVASQSTWCCWSHWCSAMADFHMSPLLHASLCSLTRVSFPNVHLTTRTSYQRTPYDTAPPINMEWEDDIGHEISTDINNLRCLEQWGVVFKILANKSFEWWRIVRTGRLEPLAVDLVPSRVTHQLNQILTWTLDPEPEA